MITAELFRVLLFFFVVRGHVQVNLPAPSQQKRLPIIVGGEINIKTSFRGGTSSCYTDADTQLCADVGIYLCELYFADRYKE